MPHPQQKNLSGVRSIFTILRKGSFNEIAAWLAQLAGRRSAGPEVAGSNFGRTNTEESAAFVMTCKRLHFLAFSDKDEKP